MNHRRSVVALSVNTLAFALLLAGCGDDQSGTPAATGGSGQTASGGTQDGTGGDAAGGAAAGGAAAGGAAQGGSGGGVQPTGGVTGQGGGVQPTGGVTGQGGSGAGGGGATTCSDVVPCGGDVVGTWTVTTSCLNMSGDMDMRNFGLGCDTAQVTGSLDVTGTFTANADGTYTDNTTTSGTHQLALPATCLEVSGTRTSCGRIAGPLASVGYSSITCQDAASGEGCDCTATLAQTAGVGLVLGFPATSGNYTTSGNALTLADDKTYSYCVSGNTLTLAPDAPLAPMTGSVVFGK